LGQSEPLELVAKEQWILAERTNEFQPIHVHASPWDGSRSDLITPNTSVQILSTTLARESGTSFFLEDLHGAVHELRPEVSAPVVAG
jgi:hypothetical protein